MAITYRIYIQKSNDNLVLKNPGCRYLTGDYFAKNAIICTHRRAPLKKSTLLLPVRFSCLLARFVFLFRLSFLLLLIHVLVRRGLFLSGLDSLFCRFAGV